MNLDDIITRLDKVRPASGGYMACCPAHDDKTPSLSVCEKDGHIWLYCFAGCTQDSVLEAIGYTWKDLPQKAPAVTTKRIRVPHINECDDMFLACVKADVAAGKPIPEKDKVRYQNIVRRQRAA